MRSGIHVPGRDPKTWNLKTATHFHNIFHYYSSWKDQHTQPGSDHWKSMDHFVQRTNIHFCARYSWTREQWKPYISTPWISFVPPKQCTVVHSREGQMGNHSLAPSRTIIRSKVYKSLLSERALDRWKIFVMELISWFGLFTFVMFFGESCLITRVAQTEFPGSLVLVGPSICCWTST